MFTEPGTAREEAERLVAAGLAFASLAANAHPEIATGSAACCVCPFCKLIDAVRDPDPQVVERIATGAGDLAVGVAGLLRGLSAMARPSADPWSTATAASDDAETSGNGSAPSRGSASSGRSASDGAASGGAVSTRGAAGSGAAGSSGAGGPVAKKAVVKKAVAKKAIAKKAVAKKAVAPRTAESVPAIVAESGSPNGAAPPSSGSGSGGNPQPRKAVAKKAVKRAVPRPGSEGSG